MADTIQVKIPDIGDAQGVEIIEVLVNKGDMINVDDSLIVLETDKATMEVPSSHAGLVTSVEVKVGDKVSEGDVILWVEAATASSEPEEIISQSNETEDNTRNDSDNQVLSETQPIIIPDIGDAAGVDVIEVTVRIGDTVEKDDSLIVLETEKATMEVPSPFAGVIQSLTVKVGDKVSQGDEIGSMQVKTHLADSVTQSTVGHKEEGQKTPTEPQPDSTPVLAKAEKESAPVSDYPVQTPSSSQLVHASPAVRRVAREFGVDLTKVKGSGPKNRILKEDIQSFVKFELSRPKATAGSAQVAPDLPDIDFSKFGDIETTSLTRIQKISSVTLQRNWNLIPHVTQHEDADITELDNFRKAMKDEAAKEGVRLTPLAFIMKALVASLKAFPTFNSSLAADGETLILKKYFNIGVAVDTPDGLVVPVIRQVDKKSVYELANELGEISQKARDKKLTAADMQGSSMTISSLGGIGGTAFTPIVNWPDVAILGLSRNKIQPVWNGKEFEPRMMLPMSLSYDHRVIDGAVAARFIVHLSKMLEDIRRVIL